MERLKDWVTLIIALAAFFGGLYATNNTTQYRLDKLESKVEGLENWRLSHVSTPTN